MAITHSDFFHGKIEMAYSTDLKILGKLSRPNKKKKKRRQ
jgi:hypothetical protein